MTWITYLAAALTLLYGIVVEGIVNQNWNEAVNYILAALAMIGFRRAITKVENKV